jgi:DNA/RNA endonuclease G (NUC1)
VAAICVTLVSCGAAGATDFLHEELDSSYRHERFGIEPTDIGWQFRAYNVSFDSDDDDDGDGKPDRWGIPEWVAYQIKSYPRRLPKYPRPSPWITVPELFEARIAPSDATYKDSDFDRGHMCMKQIAARLGKAADWNTHTVLNACPQYHDFNDGIWKGMELMTARWADEFGSVWVVCGPIFRGRKPTKWIGEGDEVRAAVPHAFFKIVAKNSGTTGRPDVMAFIYPHKDDRMGGSSLKLDHSKYLKSVRTVEEQTGLNFFSKLDKADQDAIEEVAASEVWPLDSEDAANHRVEPTAPGGEWLWLLARETSVKLLQGSHP